MLRKIERGAFMQLASLCQIFHGSRPCCQHEKWNSASGGFVMSTHPVHPPGTVPGMAVKFTLCANYAHSSVRQSRRGFSFGTGRMLCPKAGVLPACTGRVRFGRGRPAEIIFHPNLCRDPSPSRFDVLPYGEGGFIMLAWSTDSMVSADYT
jgi:hypothetical protein